MDVVAEGNGQGAGVKWVTVQICSFCWFQANPDRKPVRVKGADTQRCYDCDAWTRGGIFVRREEKPVDGVE